MRKMTIMVAILFILCSNIVFADENVKTHKFNKEVEISGVLGSSSNYFYVEENMDVVDAKFNLVFTKSELLDPNYSTITIYINDTPINSQRLSGEKIYKNQVSINIPKELIKSGYNEVKIKAYKTISDKICSDDNNSANWLVVHKESNINMKYNYKQFKNEISSYKDIFMNIDNGQNLNTTIVLPKDYSSKELSAAMIMSSDIGKKIKHENYNFDIVTYDEFDNKNNNIIFIGSAKNSPEEILKLLTNYEKNMLENNSVIKIVDSIFDKNKKMLLMLSNKEELIINTAKLVSSDVLINNVDKDTLYINSQTSVDDIIKEKNNNKILLKDLGYENIHLKGPFTQEAIIDVNTPKSKIVSVGSKINMNIKYSQNLDFDRSLVTLYVNDVVVGSKQLEKTKANNDTVEFNIPDELLNKNQYQIKLVFNLEVLDLSCVTRDMDTPWAYIGNDSNVEFVYNDNNELKLSNYPYPFVNKNSFNDISIVVPNDLNSKEITQIANIISFMGRDKKYNTGDINVVKESEFSNKHKNTNLIIIGTPTTNQLIKDVNKNLNLKFNNDFIGFESDKKVKFIDDISSQVASIQLIKSPYSKDKSAMVITSTYTNDLSLSTKYLTDLEGTKSLTGDTVVIYKNGYIDDLNYNIIEDVEQEDKKEINISEEAKKFIIVVSILLVTIVVSVILLMKRNKR